MGKKLILVFITALIGYAFFHHHSSYTEEVTISCNGKKLRGYLKRPTDQTCPLIILMHGLMDSGEFPLIRKQGEAYVKAGYAVLAVDFDGHGKSDGTLLEMTISKEVEDAEAIFAYAETLPNISNIILLGHSQGGVIASITASHHPDEISSLILEAPGGMISDTLRSGVCFGQPFDIYDPPEKVMVFDDYISKDYIVDAMNMDLYAMAEGYTDHPVLLISGTDDQLVTEDVIDRYKNIYKDNAEHKTIENAPHDFLNHEDEVISTVLSFLRH